MVTSLGNSAKPKSLSAQMSHVPMEVPAQRLQDQPSPVPVPMDMVDQHVKMMIQITLPALTVVATTAGVA
jgi:hypothetical protein